MTSLFADLDSFLNKSAGKYDQYCYKRKTDFHDRSENCGLAVGRQSRSSNDHHCQLPIFCQKMRAGLHAR